MKADDIRKLLGGYATGTLTREEREALFTAALEDQELFDALADEEALKDLLVNEEYRRELAESLAKRESGLGEKLAAWWRRPLPLALSGATAVLAVAFVILYQAGHPSVPVQQVAMNRPAPQASPAEPVQRATSSQPAPQAALRELEESPTAAPESGLGEIQKAEGARLVSRKETSAPPPAAPVRPGKQVAAPLPGAAPEEKKVAAAAVQDVMKERREEAMAKERAQSATEADAAIAARGHGAAKVGAAIIAGSRRDAPAETQYRQPSAVASPQLSEYQAAPTDVEGISVTVEVKTGPGEFRPVSSRQILDRQDVVRLRVRTPGPGLIYVSAVDGGRDYHLLFSGPVGDSGQALVPTGGSLAPPVRPGPRTISVVYSREALATDQITPSLFVAKDKAAAPARRFQQVTIQYR